MTAVVQSITPNSIPQYSLANQTWINAVSTVIGLSSDRTTFYGASGASLQTSTNADTATTPAWTTIKTFPTTNGQTVSGIVELLNGEAMVVTTESSQAVNLSHVYVSTGWSTNKSTATWAETLVFIGGYVTGAYALHDFANSANGTVLMSESGGQTLGGAGNIAADVLKARRVWMSKDFGKTWTLIFDVYNYGATQGFQYPAGVHIHGVSYDQDWNRIWVCYGDNTGDGKLVAGTGYTQVVYSDDGGTTWVKLPTPKYWSNAGQGAMTLQCITAAIFPNAVVFSPDVTEPTAPLVYPKLGYRVLGEPHPGPAYPSGVSGIIRKVVRDSTAPTFFPGMAFPGGGTYTSTITWRIPVTDDDGFTWSRITGQIPAQTPALTSNGFINVFGPTLNGRVVLTGGMYINNDNTKKTMQADLVFG